MKCKKCDRIIVCKGGSTASMLYHIKTLHSEGNKDEKKKQTTLMSIVKKCDPMWSNRLSTLIASMIADDGLAISFIEGTGFTKLMKFVEPEYHLQAKETVLKILNGKYEEEDKC